MYVISRRLWPEYHSNRHMLFSLLCRMSISEGCDTEKVTSLLKQHVPNAKLSRQQDAELTFTLPFESMNTFSGQIRFSIYVSTFARLFSEQPWTVLQACSRSSTLSRSWGSLTTVFLWLRWKMSSCAWSQKGKWIKLVSVPPQLFLFQNLSGRSEKNWFNPIRLQRVQPRADGGRMRQRLSGRHRPAAAHLLRQQNRHGFRPRSVAAAVQRRGVAAHAQHAQGVEGLRLHVSSFDGRWTIQVQDPPRISSITGSACLIAHQ